jgi:glucoamylase
MDVGIEEKDITRPKRIKRAKGRPGAKPVWASGAKQFVGTALSARSRIWFTIGKGALNEIYFPDVDQANTRHVRLLISDGASFFSNEMSDADHTVTWAETGAPSCHIESRCKDGRYTIIKDIVLDPVRDTLLLRVQFTPSGDSKLHLYLQVDPHIGDMGAKNDAWVGDYLGEPMMLARRKELSLAVAARPALLNACCGYIGRSDGYTLLSKFKPLSQSNSAMQGNVDLTAELDYVADEPFLVSLACGAEPAEAGQQARAGILQDFDKVRALFLQQWKQEQDRYDDVRDLSEQKLDMYRVSTAVLETHQSKRFPGGFVASLSLPWGFSRSDQDVGGYHVLWPRDLVETAMGKLACGDARSARSALFYLACTQNGDGGWSQNMWLDGTPHWGAIQMDGIAWPILLADKLRRENALDGYDPEPMVHSAAYFLLKNGPVTQQGRWEALPGYSPYTMATEIAALLAAADFADSKGKSREADFLRQTADAWNDCVEEFTYVSDTPLAKKHGVEGYYVRMTPPERVEAEATGNLKIVMSNLPVSSRRQRAIDIISPDALELVRFGLRSARDPKIVNTVKLLDATLKHDTATGPGWTRSTKDGYGEKKSGRPFDKTGIGRCWPLLAGERAHYEIAVGNIDFAVELLKTMARQTSQGGMIPEQVWNAPDIAKHSLYNGHPNGSGMPLVWAHSEYIKLLRSLHNKAVWDMPPQPVERYQQQKHTSSFQIWTPQQKRGWLARGKDLRIDLSAEAEVKWSTGSTIHRQPTTDTGLGLHCALLPTAGVPGGSSLRFEILPSSKDQNGSVKHESATVKVSQ